MNHQRANYIPTLDGWRTVAIALVMGFHFLTHQDRVPSKIQFYAGFGGYGVDIFFALSGFLICTRILIGMKKYGTLNLKVFYIRRTFRILPPALLYLLFLAILTSFNIINVTKWEFISAMTFWRNYLPIEFAAPLSFTNHFWSLSIEEHFYLFFPFLMIYIPKQRRLYSLIMLALIIAFWRAVDSRYNLLTGISPYLEYNYQFTFARLDNLLWGAILAIIYFNENNKKLIDSYLKPWVGYLLIMFISLIIIFPIPAKRILLAILFPVMILFTVVNPKCLLSLILETKVFRWVGGLSYGLYLWQHLFLNGSQEISPEWFSLLQSAYLSIPLTFVCAFLSYHLLELPLIKVGRKTSQKFSSY